MSYSFDFSDYVVNKGVNLCDKMFMIFVYVENSFRDLWGSIKNIDENWIWLLYSYGV